MTESEGRARIARTQQGDADAFGPLVLKYQPRIYTHIHKVVRDAETAKDLTQETWLKALRSIKSFRGESGFSSWLYRIAENVCIDYFRKQRHDIAPLHAIEEHHITETIPCPSRDILRQELRLLLRDAIAHLTPSAGVCLCSITTLIFPSKRLPSVCRSPKARSKRISGTRGCSSRKPSPVTFEQGDILSEAS